MTGKAVYRPDITQPKECSKCKITKPINCFYKKKEAYDGHQASCSACENAKSRAQYAQSSKEAKTIRDTKKVANERFNQKNPHKRKEYQQKRISKLKELEQRITKLEELIKCQNNH